MPMVMKMNNINHIRKYWLICCSFIFIGSCLNPANAALDLAYCSADASVLFRKCEQGSDSQCKKEIERSIGKAVQVFTADKGCFGSFPQYKTLADNYNSSKASITDAKDFLRQLKQPIIDLRAQQSLVSATGVLSDFLKQELDKAIATFESRNYSKHTESNGIFTKAYWDINPFETAVIGEGTSNSLAVHDLYAYLREVCITSESANSHSPPEDCHRRFGEVRSSLQVAETLSALFFYTDSFRVFVAEAYVDKLLDEWRYYFEEARVQYPWELASDLDDVLEDAPPGLLRAPTKQTFWLHPAAGLSYVEGAEDGQQLRPTAILEIYGKNYWDFKPNSATAELDGHAWGWSLITNYTDIQDIDDVGVGLSVHYDHKYTASFSYHDDDEWVVSFNINLASHLQNLWRDKKQEYDDKIKMTKTKLNKVVSDLSNL